MKIALIGYGKMGKTIEKIALNRKHKISAKIDKDNQADFYTLNAQNTDVAIEFTQPETSFDNLKYCIDQKIPVVCGTTGWLERKKELEEYCLANEGAFFYASNYSIGVNLFFQLNQWLAQLMKEHPQYEVGLEEIHHTEKKDAPSGTAITLAEGIFPYYPQKTTWINEASDDSSKLSIISKREENVPGTHTIAYQSDIDSIEIKHTAFGREGFATGAVLAAEWIAKKQGVFGMQDLLKLPS
jgi:4-hydroxy-tetrahydrodipicolinate reductase